MSQHDLLLYSKTETLFFRIYPALRNFPKSEKFARCHQIKEHFIELLKNTSLANSVKSKRKTYLQEADGILQNVKTLVRLSKHQKYLSKGFYEDIHLNLSEINALLVGYIKQTVSKK
ncbi:MAG: four helix bundle protein [Elusimicrobiota bacterium]